MNAFTIFTKAKETLEKNPEDSKAQFIVDLWNASSNLHNKNVALQAEVEALKAELAAIRSENADYARKQDMLETKLSGASGSFNAQSWLASQYAIAAAGAATGTAPGAAA